METRTAVTGTAACSMAASGPRVSGDAPAVLLVDDEPAVLDIAGRYIARCGCRVLTAGTPAAALQLAAVQGRVDLLVSDVMMPGMTGPELYGVLAERIPSLKVIFISGHAGAALSVRDAVAHGALFLQKPFSVTEMRAKLHEAFAGPPAAVPALL